MTRRNSTPAAGGTLTPGQEALWLVQHLDPQGAAYNVTAALDLLFTVDAAVLEQAAGAAVSGHALLGSLFTQGDDGRIRRTPAPTPFALERYEPGLAGEELRAFALRLSRRPFRPAHERPVRIALIRPRTGPDVLLATAHHIAADNISQLLLCREILSRYAALRAGRPYTARDTGAAFEDFAQVQRAYLASSRAERARAYWARELGGVTAHLELPADLPRPALWRQEGAEVRVDLPAGLVADLDAAAAERNVTAFALLLSVFAVLLHRASGQREFLVGYPVSQRQGARWRDAMGYFVNTLPLRARVDPGDSFEAVLRRTSLRLWQGLLHRDYPFALLAGLTGLPRDPSRPGPVQVLFVLNEPGGADPIAGALTPGAVVEHAGLRVAEFALPQQHGQFELTLQLTRHAAGFQAVLKYHTSLFTAGTAGALAEEYVRLLRAAVAGTLVPAASPAPA
jgi:hypothetical protein